MRYWRLALLALLCCLTMRETVVFAAQQVESLVAGQADEHGLPPNSEMPAPAEEGEADWLLVECEGESTQSPAIVVELNLVAIRSHGGATFHCCIDGREILNALHRLRI
jgi:hypothetical protein